MPGGLQSGADIDPLTRIPVERETAAKTVEREQQEEKTLREQAEFLNIVSSAEGSRLIDIIAKRLENRIDELINNDPEATAYAHLLKEVGRKETLARRAVDKLYNRHRER